MKQIGWPPGKPGVGPASLIYFLKKKIKLLAEPTT